MKNAANLESKRQEYIERGSKVVLPYMIPEWEEFVNGKYEHQEEILNMCLNIMERLKNNEPLENMVSQLNEINAANIAAAKINATSTNYIGSGYNISSGYILDKVLHYSPLGLKLWSACYNAPVYTEDKWKCALKRYEMHALLNNGENANAFMFSFSPDKPLMIMTDEFSDAKSSMNYCTFVEEIMKKDVDGAHRSIRLVESGLIKQSIQNTYERIARAQGHEPIEHDLTKETLSNCLLKIYISDIAGGRFGKTVSFTPERAVQCIQSGGVDRELGVDYRLPGEIDSTLSPCLDINYTAGEGQLEKAKEFLAQEMAMFDEKVPQERVDFCNEVMKQLEIAIDLEAKETSPVSDAVLEETPTTTPKHEPTTLNESEDVLDGTYTPSQAENTQPKEDIEYDESQIENEL